MGLELVMLLDLIVTVVAAAIGLGGCIFCLCHYVSTKKQKY